jgi:hypothetical protein
MRYQCDKWCDTPSSLFCGPPGKRARPIYLSWRGGVPPSALVPDEVALLASDGDGYVIFTLLNSRSKSESVRHTEPPMLASMALPHHAALILFAGRRTHRQLP